MPGYAYATIRPPRATRRRLTPAAAFYLQISMLVFFLAGSSAPTPLYAVYEAEWGFSPITVTVVFGVYAIAVLAALLTVGSLSDHVGRRPVLLVAVLVQAVVMAIFATAAGVPALLVGRVLQGLSTGAAVAALGAGILDIDKERGTVANAVAPMTGTATGALGSALLVTFLPAPTHVVYVLLGLVFLAQAAGVALMPESSAPRPGALASLRPQFAMPPAVRRPLLAAAPVLLAAWALAGFYGALAPSLVRLMSGSQSLLLGGLALFALAGSGGAVVLLLRDAGAERLMIIGTSALVAGVGVTLGAVSASSVVLFFAGTMIAGVGFGAGFQGALRTVVPLAREHERAGVLSILFVVSYLAMGLPAVIGGYLVVHGGGVADTAQEYGAAVMALAALALGTLAWTALTSRAGRRIADRGGAVCPAVGRYE